MGSCARPLQGFWAVRASGAPQSIASPTSPTARILPRATMKSGTEYCSSTPEAAPKNAAPKKQNPVCKTQTACLQNPDIGKGSEAGSLCLQNPDIVKGSA